MNIYLPRSTVLPLLEMSVQETKVLTALYDHTDGTERVRHRLAVFDFGTTNPKTYDRNKNNVYCYAFDHRSDKTNLPDPKVIAFNVDHFVDLVCTDEVFDPVELTDRHLRATKYDYRACNFALLPGRGWYK